MQYSRDARRSLRTVALRVAIAIAAIAAIVWMIHSVGAGAIARVAVDAVAWLPLVAALEAARICFEALATRSLQSLGGAPAVPSGRLLLGHVIANAAALVLPAGRVAAEALKAKLFAKTTGWAVGIAVAAQNQALSLAATAVVVALGGGAAIALGASAMVVALSLGVAAVLAILGVLTATVARGRVLTATAARLFPSAGEVAREGAAIAARAPRFPRKALALHVCGRLMVAHEIGVLMIASGAKLGPLSALAAYALHQTGASLGDLLPAQLGATEGALTAAASQLGLSASRALFIALALHAVQLVWVAAGAVAAVVTAGRKRAGEAPAGAGVESAVVLRPDSVPR